MAHVKVGQERIEGEGRIDDLMRSHGYYPDSFLYLIGGMPVPSDTEITGDQEAEAIRVASGG